MRSVRSPTASGLSGKYNLRLTLATRRSCRRAKFCHFHHGLLAKLRLKPTSDYWGQI